MRLGIVEASQNKIGSLADQVLLYCYHYDPRTGKLRRDHHRTSCGWPAWPRCWCWAACMVLLFRGEKHDRGDAEQDGHKSLCGRICLFFRRAPAPWRDTSTHCIFFLVAMAAFFTVLISVLILFFAIRYRKERHPARRPDPRLDRAGADLDRRPAGHRDDHLRLVGGDFLHPDAPPEGAMEIYCVGKQWMWKFAAHRRAARDQRAARSGGPRRALIMTSQDVIHAFFVPAFRIKADVLPGRYTSTWFHATQPGRYHLFCSQYCGTQHSGMIGEVVVMDPADYERWAARRRRMDRWPRRAKRASSNTAAPCAIVPTSPDARPNLIGLYRQAGAAGRRPHRDRRRELCARVDSESGRKDRQRLQEHHADLPGPD